MRLQTGWIGLALAALGLVAVRPAAQGAVVRHTHVLDTLPLPCDTVTRAQWWAIPYALTIRHVSIHPLSDGAPDGEPFPQVDLQTTVWVSRPTGTVLLSQPLDHYRPFTSDPVAWRHFDLDEAPRLWPGDNVAVLHSCDAIFDGYSHSRYTVVIDYTDGW